MKSTRSFAVYNANTPRKTVRMSDGTIPVPKCSQCHFREMDETVKSKLARTDNCHRVWQCEQTSTNDLSYHQSADELRMAWR